MPLTGELLLGLLTFTAVTCLTPGPNNAMLLASGFNFGFQRTLPHVLGVALGCAFMVLAVGLGIGQVFAWFPSLYGGLRLLSVIYLLWLAWGIARAGSPHDQGGEGSHPMTFIEAALFQWINPKAWVMVLGATTTYVVAGQFVRSVLVIGGAFGLIGFVSSAAWALFGGMFRRLLHSPRAIGRSTM